MREIAPSIGDHLGIPTASIPADQLEAHFGFLAMVIALDNPTSNLATRRILGWEPKVPLEQGLKETVEYFRCLAVSRA